MTLLDAVRSGGRTAPAAPPADRADAGADSVGDAGAVTRPVVTGRQLGVLLLILAVLLGGTLALVFGPARGIRTDIVSVSDDLDASRDGIFLQLGTARTQLGLTEQSLEVQEAGLAVAAEAEQDASVAAQSTQALLAETRSTLELVREVTRSLGPDLGQQLDDVVRDVEQGLEVARQTLKVAQQTLVVAQQTLATGREGLAVAREALAVAKDTNATLKRSEQIQVELLRNAEEINRKIPGAPVFPTTSSPAP